MSSLNRAELIGNLTRDPEVKQFKDGREFCNFSIATNYSYKDDQGERHDKPEYHNIVCFSKLTQVVSKYLRKGSKVFVEGRLQTRSWEAEDGTKRYMTEIVLLSMIMLSSKRESSEAGQQEQAPPPVENQPMPFVQEDAASLDDLPF